MITIYLTGVLLLVVGLYFLFCFFTNALAAFLHVNEPVHDADVLIVEGWLSQRFAESVKEEFQKGTYKYILISGFADEIYSKHDGKEITKSDT